MSEGWKQVWQDIRHALRGPTAVEEQEAGAGEQRRRGEEFSETSAAPEQAREQPDPHPKPGLETQTIRNDLSGEAGWETGKQGSEASEIQNLIDTQKGAKPALPVLSEAEGSKGSKIQNWMVVLTVGLLLLAAFFFYRSRLAGATPPAPNVVATFDGGQITVEDVRQHLAELVPDAAMQAQFQNIQGYRLIVEEMLTDELVRRWAAEREADRDEDIQHVMEHITEEINLDELHTQLHEGQMGVTEGDIQAYYQANRDQFGDLTVTQVRDQIRTTLQSQQEDQFVQNYIDSLKDKATITRNFDLLAVPEPAEQELEAYYQTNKEQFLLPARAVVNEIRIPVEQDEAVAREQADNTLVRLRSGEAFAAVALEVSQTPLVEGGLTVVKGQRDPAYDEVVFNLDEGETSAAFQAGDAFYIVWLHSKEPERQQSLDEVRAQVQQAVQAQKEAAWFEEKANQTLLTIDGRRYTVGEFWREYRELPAPFIFDYQGTAGRQALAERLIERLLLVEDSYDQLLEADNQVELEEIRLDVLAQMMEQEEVDDQIEITDEELRVHYEQDKAQLVEPPQARIRQIMIRSGQTEDEYQRAWEKADEAYQKLAPGLFQAGADFAEVAREYSEDELTAAQGGEAPGWIGESQDLLSELVEHPFHQQVLRLAEGEISRPFEWNGAIYIVQVLERTEPKPLSFEETKEMLREELRLQKHQELEVQLSERLLEQFNVTVYDQALEMLLEEQQGGQP